MALRQRAHLACADQRQIGGRWLPYCSGFKAIPGQTDLATVHPGLAAQWHPELNDGLTPDEVTAGSGKRVWWLCVNQHSWRATVSSRSGEVTGCPHCAGNLVWPGVNDLATVYPEMAKQWHPVNNGELTPNLVMPHSKQPVWWRCAAGHEWEASPKYRQGLHGCPDCTTAGTSEQEVRLRHELAAAGVPIQHDHGPIQTARLRPVRADMVCPNWRLVLEWDGKYFHANTIRQDLKQNGYLAEAGWRVVRIREELPRTTDDDCVVGIFRPGRVKDIADIVLRHLQSLGYLASELDDYLADSRPWAQADADAELATLRSVSLATENPSLAAQWHPTRNANLTPLHVSPRSDARVWWLCAAGHEWKAPVYRRARGIGCGYCAGSKAIPGETDLATVRPDLAAQRHPDRNGDLTPSRVTSRSGQKVWWRCDKAHEWDATVNDRYGGYGCPYCSGKRVLQGWNDLATVRPDLAGQWHPDRNGDLTPQAVSKGSHKRAWWRCDANHEWSAAIKDRSRHNGTGCPHCSKPNRH